jgi:hypothetical protein
MVGSVVVVVEIVVVVEPGPPICSQPRMVKRVATRIRNRDAMTGIERECVLFADDFILLLLLL